MSTPPPGDPGPNTDPDAVRRAREANRDLFTSGQVRNPWVFDSTDNPLQTLAPPQIEQAIKRLDAIAAAEGSAIVETDWESEVDSAISLSENEDHMLEIGGKLPEDEIEFAGTRAMTEDEAEEILDICEQLDGAGVDVLEAVFAEEGAQAAAMLQGTSFTEDEIEAVLDGIADEFDPLFVSDAIVECRDLLAGPELVEREAAIQEILEELRERFGVTALTMERAFAQLEDRLARAEHQSQEPATNRLSRAFGERFGSLDEAIDRLRERIAAARGERLRIADIRVRQAAGDTRVFIDSDDQAFTEWLDNVQRRVRRELDLSAIPEPATVTVGEILVRGETLDEIDLTQGRERVGAVAEPLPEERTAREQETLPEPETDVEALADRAIELLER